MVQPRLSHEDVTVQFSPGQVCFVKKINLTTYNCACASTIDEAFATATRETLMKPILNAWHTFLWCARHYHTHTNSYHPESFLVSLGRAKVIPEDDDEDAIDEAKASDLYSRITLAKKASTIMVDLNKYLTQKREEREKTDPMPASPIHPPILNVWFHNIKDDRKFNLGFSALHGARRAADFAISNRHTEWLDDNTLLVDNLIKITTDFKPDGLSQIIEHEFTPRERAWELPGEYMRRIHSLFSTPEPRASYLDPTPKSTPMPKAPKPKKTPKPEKAPRLSGLIDLPTLLADTDIEPKEARNALRKMNTPKPAHGRWEWEPSAAQQIKASIVKKVKELRK